MQEQRRSFLKKAAGASAVVAASGLMASTTVKQSTDGVVVGRSNKKEILYRETPEWSLYYKRSY